MASSSGPDILQAIWCSFSFLELFNREERGERRPSRNIIKFNYYQKWFRYIIINGNIFKPPSNETSVYGKLRKNFPDWLSCGKFLFSSEISKLWAQSFTCYSNLVPSLTCLNIAFNSELSVFHSPASFFAAPLKSKKIMWW